MELFGPEDLKLLVVVDYFLEVVDYYLDYPDYLFVEPDHYFGYYYYHFQMEVGLREEEIEAFLDFLPLL